jgi:hypothetical protein
MQKQAHPTNLEIAQAADYYLYWVEYVDPGAMMTPAEHAAMSVGERMAMLVDMFGDDTVADEAEANGRLAAAAPDMLAALEVALTTFIGTLADEAMTCNDLRCVQLMRAAVAKAKGEQPTS